MSGLKQFPSFTAQMARFVDIKMSADQHRHAMGLNKLEKQLISQFSTPKNIDDAGCVRVPAKKAVTYVHDSDDERPPPIVGLGSKAT